MPVYEQTVSQMMYFSHSCSVYSQSIEPHYGTLADAENYFKSKISSQVTDWTDADPNDKVAALREATRIMETLNFRGTPESDSQLLFFPTSEYGQPADIAQACYEIALKLLAGIDPDTEQDNLSVEAQGYAGARTSYDRSYNQEHTRAGIPSARAWSILRPYLCDPEHVILRRGA